MTTLMTNSILSEIQRLEILSPGTRGYFQARLRNRIYDLVLTKFREQEQKPDGLTRAELARRIGRKPEIITRLLGAPGNWTLETVSDLLLGITGEELDATASSPLNRPQRNYRTGDDLRSKPVDIGTQAWSSNAKFELAGTS